MCVYVCLCEWVYSPFVNYGCMRPQKHGNQSDSRAGRSQGRWGGSAVCSRRLRFVAISKLSVAKHLRTEGLQRKEGSACHQSVSIKLETTTKFSYVGHDLKLSTKLNFESHF
jgi:hypothetical protein